MKNSEWFSRLLQKEGCDATWHPEKDSIVLERAKGSLVWDVEGNSYIDMIAGFGSLALGHNHDSLQEQFVNSDDKIMQGMGDVYSSKYKIEFIETLLSFLPSYLNRVSLAVTGSQAVEYAMKTAMLATKGSGFICFEGAYHGLDFGALAVTSQSYFRNPFVSWLNTDCVQHLPFLCDEKTLREAFHTFRQKNILPAAILVEPILGRGGFKAASFEWLQSLKKIAKEEGCLLIFDEVFTGFGRSGRVTFAEELDCDLVCFGKAIGGGMPISACVGRAEVMNAWPVNHGEAIHTGTFFGHPLSCRVGLATLRLIKEQNLIQNSKQLGEEFLKRLKKALEISSRIKEVRGNGLMIAVEFKDPKDSLSAMSLLQSKGIFVIPCGTQGECVSLTPALNIETSALDAVLSALTEVVSYLEKRYE